ncbi:MAG TPA: nucleotidyltransferase domain-containing protein, partial [Terriglobales bacterium]
MPLDKALDNKTIAGLLYETADLMEIDAADPFRIRSYRRAAESVDGLPAPIWDLIPDQKKLLEIPGIGKGMAANLRELMDSGKLGVREELMAKYRPSMLELLRIQGLGPKTIQLIWSAYQVCDVEGVEKLAKEGKIRTLPRMGEKQEQKILKGIEDYRRLSGRFHLDDADRVAQQLAAHLAGLPGVEKVTPAGSLRRGRETVGDLDVLVTGDCCNTPKQRDAVLDRIVNFPGILDVLAKGENKVSFKLRSGLQVDVRLLPPESYGAAMLYFTGSKSHNVALRQRALKMGYTLNEYALAKLDTNKKVAGKTEEGIYKKLGMDWIAPEMRENSGEIELAA